MPSHRITTTTLRRAIEDQRAADARSRWDEVVHQYMTPVVPTGSLVDPSPSAGTRP